MKRLLFIIGLLLTGIDLIAAAPELVSSAQVEGLKIVATTADGKDLKDGERVPFDDKFFLVRADTQGKTVRWRVFGTKVVKFYVHPTQKELTVGVPDGGEQVVIEAVTAINGEPTDFATLVIQSTGTAPIPPGPVNPPSPPRPAAKQVYVSIVYNAAQLTPEQAGVINSQAFRTYLTNAAVQYKQIDASVNPRDLQPPPNGRGLQKYVDQAGGVPTVIVQDETGLVRANKKLPTSDAELIGIIRAASGR